MRRRTAIRGGLRALLLLLIPGGAWAQAPGPLSVAHSDMDNALGCPKCHEGGFGVPDNKCLACHEHQPLRDRIKADKGFHADDEVKKKACKDCHPEHKKEGDKGRTTTIDWRPFGGKRNFEHQRTGWPLQGAHRFQQCEACHKKKYKKTQLTTYLGLRGDCITCHGKENPHQFTDTKLIDCLVCHDYDTRKVPNLGVTKFDHDKTAFPLDGSHVRNACVSCHKEIKLFKVTDRKFDDCAGCHKDSHRSVISATKKCAACHSTKVKFAATKFDHAKETKFALNGQHGKNKCASCHKVDGGNEKPKMACETCHKDHHRGRFGKETCDGCHADGGPEWKKIHFAHDKKTKFELTGRHADIFCTECHRDREPKSFEQFKTTGCADCHRHQDAHCGQFGMENCARCHIKGGDRILRFDHGLTRFPLERAHAAVGCERCHKPARLGDSARCKETVKYTGLEPACLSCHEDIHQGSLGKDCQRCHTAGANFKTLVFDHNKDSRFSLTGFHQIVECATCHPERRFKLGDMRCFSCHKEDDVHLGALGDDCARCHETTGGAPKFDHEVHTDFAREGVHRRIECERCHFLAQDGSSPVGEKVAPAKGKKKAPVTNAELTRTTSSAIAKLAGTLAAIAPPGSPLDLKFRVAGESCESCHPDPHRVRAAGLDCGSCHAYETWQKPPKNGYHEGAGFSLSGAHTAVQCSLCHVGAGSMLGKGESCGSCHNQDDVHAGSLGSDCGKCHQQQAWLPSTYSHMDTSYVLQGVHRTLECRQCHLAGNFWVGNRCYNCHLEDYRQSVWHTDEIRRAADPAKGNGKVIIYGGYQVGGQPVPLDCDACHNQFSFFTNVYTKPPGAGQ